MGVLGVFSGYKVVFLGSVLSCLAVASVYQYYARLQYRLESTLQLPTLEVKNRGSTKAAALGADVNSPATLNYLVRQIKVLKSKTTLKKAVTDLGLQVSYFKKGFPRQTELYGNSQPVLVKIITATPRLAKQTLEVAIISKSTFLLKTNHAATVHRFNRAVKIPGAVIKVVPGPAFNRSGPPVLVKFKSANALVTRYYQKLQVNISSEEANTLELSLIEPVPQKGIDLLNQVVQVYNQHQDLDYQNRLADLNRLEKQMQFLQQTIADLNSRTAFYQRWYNSATQKFMPQSKLSAAEKEAYQKQLHSIAAIKPYVSVPVWQFNQIPDRFDVGDSVAQVFINQYNQKQRAKQALLKHSTAGAPGVVESNKLLFALQNKLLERINDRQAYLFVIKYLDTDQKPGWPSRLTADSLARAFLQVNQDKQALAKIYHKLARQRNTVAAAFPAANVKFLSGRSLVNSVAPLKPKPVNTYLLALLMGMCLPVVGINKLWEKVLNGISKSF